LVIFASISTENKVPKREVQAHDSGAFQICHVANPAHCIIVKFSGYSPGKMIKASLIKKGMEITLK